MRRALCRVAVLDPIANQLQHYLDFLSARQRVVASNIANADTPGYHARDVAFDSELQQASGAPQMMDVPNLPVRSDGNNVSLDRESRLLAENALRFRLASGLLRAQLRTVREAIEGGSSR